MAGYDFGLDREFILCILKRLDRGSSIQTAYFEHNSTRLNHSHIIFDISFAGTHSGFWWFMREWFSGKNSNPNLTTPLHLTDNRSTCSFDLSCCHPTGFQSLQTKLTETHFS